MAPVWPLRIRRAQDTAIHLVERVLPRAPYRQCTLSFRLPLRFCLARDARLLSEVLRLFVRALFALQRWTARRLGVPRPFTGTLSSSASARPSSTPHFHVLLTEADFEDMGEGTTQLVPLPPPSDGEVERMAGVLARRVLSALRARGYSASGARTRFVLPWTIPVRPGSVARLTTDWTKRGRRESNPFPCARSLLVLIGIVARATLPACPSGPATSWTADSPSSDRWPLGAWARSSADSIGRPGRW